ncbi:MAG: 2-amino-4-hydroxy-6-hydroxymethyldihydropteridine diphosphokinase [Spirochaetia bacterium]
MIKNSSNSFDEENRVSVFISLGSNQGNCEQNIFAAVRSLSGIIENSCLSPLYRTAPMYDTRQSAFINGVLFGTTHLPPKELLQHLHSIEYKIGRDRNPERRFGPRTIDLDMLLYSDRVIQEKSLEIPHPRMYERKFVLIPLLRLSPLLEDPVTHKPFFYYLAQLDSQGIFLNSLKWYTD